ncbi:hypothetical protein [Sphingomonas sp. UYEF23]|uniref:hypothetical protein n=1 Tax=Sphingomonas sp. UYEF23 TaxID=1756408 RepID=UPI003397300F
MPNKTHLWLKRHLPVLFDEKMPVWMTIVASIAAAVATYYFAPLYSHKFQIEDVRSGHLKQTTDNINDEIIELSQKIRRFDSALANKNKNSSDLHEDCLDLITKLQWRLIDLKVVLTKPDDKSDVSALSDALEGVRIKLNAPVTPRYQADIRSSMGNLAAATRNVLNKLYIKASLQD